MYLHNLPKVFSQNFLRVRNENFFTLAETDKKWAISFALKDESKVYLHAVEEVSSYDIRPQFLWEAQHSINLLITRKQTYTTSDARQLTVGQRKCIFHGETHLFYYKNDIYSLSACMKQCRMQKANEWCKCIPPFYAPATGTYQQCTLESLKCLKDNQRNITDIKGCLHCELSCMDTVYESEKIIKTLASRRFDVYRKFFKFRLFQLARLK